MSDHPAEGKLPHLTRQFDLLRKGSKAMGLHGWEDEFGSMQDSASAGTITVEEIVEVIDSDYRNDRGGREALESFIKALLADALRSQGGKASDSPVLVQHDPRVLKVQGVWFDKDMNPIEDDPATPSPSGNGSMPRLLKLLDEKLAQLKHYHDNCQIGHARAVAEGRIQQINQICHWIDDLGLRHSPAESSTRLIEIIEALIVSAEQNTDDDGNIYPHAARAIADARKFYREGA